MTGMLSLPNDLVRDNTEHVLHAPVRFADEDLPIEEYRFWAGHIVSSPPDLSRFPQHLEASTLVTKRLVQTQSSDYSTPSALCPNPNCKGN